jgi:hypothetical protein
MGTVMSRISRARDKLKRMAMGSSSVPKTMKDRKEAGNSS